MPSALSLTERHALFGPIAHERGRATCPCCGYPSLPERRADEVCLICYWEDDGQDDPNASQVRGGPNYDYSLDEARDNFERHGTMYRERDQQHFNRETSGERRDRKQRLVTAYQRVAASEVGSERDAAWAMADRM